MTDLAKLMTLLEDLARETADEYLRNDIAGVLNKLYDMADEVSPNDGLFDADCDCPRGPSSHPHAVHATNCATKRRDDGSGR